MTAAPHSAANHGAANHGAADLPVRPGEDPWSDAELAELRIELEKEAIARPDPPSALLRSWSFAVKNQTQPASQS